MMTVETTFFGLDIINNGLVREADIALLPIYDFWRESSVGSAMIKDQKTGEYFVYLHDWERFAKLFIQTGRHRWMPDTD